MKKPNYIVYIQDSKGSRKIPCNTEDEVWEAIGSRDLEGLYQVDAFNGKSNYEFIPF